MADYNLAELPQLIAANPQLPWADFSCTPVIDFEANGQVLTTAKRCAITAGKVTIVVHLPHHAVLNKGAPWPPRAIMDLMASAVGPAVAE
jgi:hypothetical protein